MTKPIWGQGKVISVKIFVEDNEVGSGQFRVGMNRLNTSVDVKVSGVLRLVSEEGGEEVGAFTINKEASLWYINSCSLMLDPVAIMAAGIFISLQKEIIPQLPEYK